MARRRIARIAVVHPNPCCIFPLGGFQIVIGTLDFRPGKLQMGVGYLVVAVAVVVVVASLFALSADHGAHRHAHIIVQGMQRKLRTGHHCRS